jgi:four helix bundle protein
MKKGDVLKENNVIYEKSLDFAEAIVELYKYLEDTHKEYVLSKQILKAGTSIGANISEAIEAHSKKDFISKFQIALKEANETNYWLTLLHRTDFIEKEYFNRLKKKINEIISILISILKTSKNNLQ